MRGSGVQFSVRLGRVSGEIDIPAVLFWGSDITLIDRARPSIHSDADKTGLEWVLEPVWEDGVAMVRLGDITFMIETKGPVPSAGSSLLIRVDELILYDTQM